MKTYNLTIGAPHGLHSRTAAKIVDLVRSHNAKVRLFNRHNESADGDSIISLLIFGTDMEHDIRVEVESRNEEAVVHGLTEIFSEMTAA